jgi:hypothetical protein
MLNWDSSTVNSQLDAGIDYIETGDADLRVGGPPEAYDRRRAAAPHGDA